MISRKTATVVFGASTAFAGLYVLIRVARTTKHFNRKRSGCSTDDPPRASNGGGESEILKPSSRSSSSSSLSSKFSDGMNGSIGSKGRSKTKTRKVVTPKSSSSSASSSLPQMEDNSPMFDYTDPKLCQEVIKLAHNRARRRISYQVSDVSPDNVPTLGGASRFVEQVGGKSAQKRPVLVFENDFVLKPVHMDERGIREVAFYEALEASTKRSMFDTYCGVFGPKDLPNKAPYGAKIVLSFPDWLGPSNKRRRSEVCCDPDTVKKEIKLLHRLALFTPEYFGLFEHRPDSSGTDGKTQTCRYGTNYNSYILAHNLMANYSKATVLDIKMGVETFEPDAPEDKRIREINKYELQREMGFRIVGMRVFSPSSVQAKDDDGYIIFPKSFGRSLISRDEIKRAFITFFGGEEDQRLLPKDVLHNRSKAIKKVMSQLKLIRRWFQENDVFSFTSSSLLVLYESDDNSSQSGGADVKMIDFGRVRRRKGGDPGYHHGLRQLMTILEEILRDEFWSEDYDYVP
mmetsp:Transcript_4186/g.10388  ORF Transcript_4186/g.10388 Transcript_4186/m.10388 type:complete len:516 (+) Transcript_4186:299-1846(+)